MAERITVTHLRALAARINVVTGSPATYMDADRKILVGHYHVSGAYGGWCLQRTMNPGGGVTCPIGMGHIPARELYNQMHAYLRGMDDGKQKPVAMLREVLAIVDQTDPAKAHAADLRELSGADVVQCLCEMEARMREVL